MRVAYLDVSPFHHLGFVPGGSIRTAAALAMLALALAAAAAAVLLFRRRDPVEA